jgi:L-amino acid N-acyltransferase
VARAEVGYDRKQHVSREIIQLGGPMPGASIRPAQPGDAPAIARIYNHYIATSTATFDTELKSVADREAWLAQHGADYPVLVAEIGDDVVAWGSLSPWGTRCAYRHSVEVSTYVAPENVRQGLGPLMTEALVVEARKAGHHAVISQIVSENEPSLKMGARLGFVEVGRLREVGRKFERWLDVVLMELLLDPAAPAAEAAR